MKKLLLIGSVLLAAAPIANAQSPNVKGTWTGEFTTVIIGNNAHHPGTETENDPPRSRTIEFTFDFEGQDGRLVWGKSWSNPDRKEPFAGSISIDGKSILASDTDGSTFIQIKGPDLLELCYTQTGLGPSKAILASCGEMRRAK